MSLKVLFARLGPTDCNNDPQNWKCACAVQWQSQTCTKRDDGKNYPFGYGLKKTLQENENVVCTSGVRPATTMVIDSHPKLVAEMSARYCNPKTTYGEQKGWAFLIGSTELSKSWNVTNPLTKAAREASCTTSFYGVSGGTSDSVSSNIYYVWQQTYKVLSKTLMVDAENKMYGLLPDGVLTVDVPYDREPESSGAARTVYARFTSVAKKHAKLFYLTLNNVQAGIEGVTLNAAGQPIQAQPNVLEPGVQDFLWLNVKNRTLTSNVQMTVIGSEAMAPFLFRYGEYDPANIPYIYDTAPDLISSAETANARCNHLNYQFKSVNWTGPYSRAQWDQHNMVRYQPDCATESLLYYRRYFGQGNTQCEYSFWTGAGPEQFPKYTWCSILQNFDCQSRTNEKGAKVLRCSPKVYQVGAAPPP